MKKIFALILALSLTACALALPALAEDAAGAVDQTSSATLNGQAGFSGRNRMPGQGNRNGQLPQAPGQNNQNGQLPQAPGQSIQNGQQPGRFGRGGKNGAGRTGKTAKQDMFKQLLADGVITQETYDAIVAWLQSKIPQAQQDAAAPAESSEAPALPQDAAPAEGSEPSALPENIPDNADALQLLKELLDSGVITQAQYDLLAGGVQAPPAAPET